jgi:hypothetical protein
MSEAQLAQLQRHFGNNVDPDVLLSVLAVVDGDVQQAIQFLQAQVRFVIT